MTLRPALRRLVIDFVRNESAAQVAFIRNRFGLGEEYSPEVYTTFYRDTGSEGGVDTDDKPFISISSWDVRDIVGTNETEDFPEYDHIASDPEIGALNGINWKRYLGCLIAHELAHTLTLEELPQFRLKVAEQFDFEVQIDYHDGHGKLWQEVYRILRRDFIGVRAYYTRIIYPYTELTREVISRPGEDRIIYIYQGQQVAFYTKNHAGEIFLSDSNWSFKRKTTFKNLSDVRKHLTS